MNFPTLRRLALAQGLLLTDRPDPATRPPAAIRPPSPGKPAESPSWYGGLPQPDDTCPS